VRRGSDDMKIGMNFICGAKCIPADKANIQVQICCIECELNKECEHKCGTSKNKNKNIMIARKGCGQKPKGKIYDIDINKLRQYIK
jgi:hypothetical protein